MEMNQTGNKITIGIGDFEVSKSPKILETFSLGSCVGIAVYDFMTKIGGLAHIMLPDSNRSDNLANPAKFADKGIQMMLDEMFRQGANRGSLVAKIVGGASMFFSAVQDPGMAIGARNVEAVKAILKSAGIRIVSEDTGGNWGRTMEFLLEEGVVVVKSAVKGSKKI